MTERPPVHATAGVLTVGTALAAGLLTLGFALALAGLSDLANSVSTLGVLVLLATPAAGLLLTIVELRMSQPRVAVLALLALAILGIAAAVAILGRA